MMKTDGTWGAVLLAGGQGRRMGGVSKAELTVEGEPFHRRLIGELEGLGGPVFYSAGAYPPPGDLTIPVIRDLPLSEDGRPAGPLGGMISCFRQTECGWLLFAACDLPFFHRELGEMLLARRTGREEALIWRTRDGRLQPLCGLYSRACLPVMEQCVKAGDRRLLSFLSRVSCRVADTEEEGIPDYWFMNVNSPEGLERAERRRPAVLAVSGIKNSGKTTLLERLVRTLSVRGIRTAVIKHDGHDFEADVPGTDSRRMQEAGAYGTVVYSSRRYLAVKNQRDSRAEDFFSLFPEADLILLEGQKHSSWPKLELVRAANGSGPVCDPRFVAAYVTDLTDERGAAGFPEKWRQKTEAPRPVFHFDDLPAITDFVIHYIDRV